MLLKMLYCVLHLLKALFHSAILCCDLQVILNFITANLIQSTGTRSTMIQHTCKQECKASNMKFFLLIV